MGGPARQYQANWPTRGQGNCLRRHGKEETGGPWHGKEPVHEQDRDLVLGQAQPTSPQCVRGCLGGETGPYRPRVVSSIPGPPFRRPTVPIVQIVGIRAGDRPHHPGDSFRRADQRVERLERLVTSSRNRATARSLLSVCVTPKSANAVGPKCGEARQTPRRRLGHVQDRGGRLGEECRSEPAPLHQPHAPAGQRRVLAERSTSPQAAWRVAARVPRFSHRP